MSQMLRMAYNRSVVITVTNHYISFASRKKGKRNQKANRLLYICQTTEIVDEYNVMHKNNIKHASECSCYCVTLKCITMQKCPCIHFLNYLNYANQEKKENFNKLHPGVHAACIL